MNHQEIKLYQDLDDQIAEIVVSLDSKIFPHSMPKEKFLREASSKKNLI